LRASFIDPDKHGERAEQRFCSPTPRFTLLCSRLLPWKNREKAKGAQKALKIQIFFKKS
jgi:hypothetical protein